MSYPSVWDISRGKVKDWDAFVKYGHNGAVTTSFTSIVTDGHMQLPLSNAAQQLRVVSTSADDSFTGLGARTVLLRGLDNTGARISEVLPLNGLTPSAFTVQSFWRLNFVDVLTSGSYATHTAGSHVGDITVTQSSGAIWAVMDSNQYPHSRWQSAWYTVPRDREAWLAQLIFTGESAKSMDIKGLARPNTLATTPPFAAMAETYELTGVSHSFAAKFDAPVGPFPPLTDIGTLGRLSNGTGSISVAMSIIERINNA